MRQRKRGRKRKIGRRIGDSCTFFSPLLPSPAALCGYVFGGKWRRGSYCSFLPPCLGLAGPARPFPGIILMVFLVTDRAVHRRLMSTFAEEQEHRYRMYKRSTLNKTQLKRIVNQTVSQSVTALPL